MADLPKDYRMIITLILGQDLPVVDVFNLILADKRLYIIFSKFIEEYVDMRIYVNTYACNIDILRYYHTTFYTGHIRNFYTGPDSLTYNKLGISMINGGRIQLSNTIIINDRIIYTVLYNLLNNIYKIERGLIVVITSTL